MPKAIKPKQLPLKLRRFRKTEVRTQFAALCYRVRKDKVQVCIITSRRTKRWILPKGWPMHKQTPAQAAATEAWEEAGLTGKAYDTCLGVYTYQKEKKKQTFPVVTLVYPMRVTNVHSDWPEAHERRRRWVSLKKAADKVSEPELKRIIASFTPAMVKR
jgi:8-oxo-dGTP pyrophosphatase MutT (NUDIX family)